MKPDGVTMESTEPTEAAAIPEPSLSLDNVTEQASSQPEEVASDAAAGPAPKTSDKPVAAELKVKPIGVASRTQPKPAGVSGSNSRPGAASHRTRNDVQSTNSVSAAATKRTASAAKASAAGAVPKRPLGGAAPSSTVKNQTRVADKKPAGPTRTTSVAAATATNGTKPTTVNVPPKKKPVAETVNLARPKTTASTSRSAASTAPKPSTSTITKAGVAPASRTTRPTTAPSTARPAPTTSRPPTAATRPSATATAKTAASRVTVVPSTGRSTAAQPPKTSTAAKKDVGRQPSATGVKKPTTATTSAATKKPESSKPTAATKLNSASKWPAKATDCKVSQPAKPPATKPTTTVRFPALNKPPLGRTPPSSPAGRPANGSTSLSKRGTKPTQAVSPFSSVKKTGLSSTNTADGQAQRAASAVVAAATASTVLAETQAEAAVTSPQESLLAAPEEVPPPVLAQDPPPEEVPQDTVQSHAAGPSPPQSPVRTALPETSPPQEQLESSASSLTTQGQVPAPAEPALPVASPPNLCEEPVYLFTNQTPSTSKAIPAATNVIPQIVPPINLNEEEDEEEREGSQLVSLSEMSGTTQPTEESRPGSAGPVAGSAWRAGGALLSELDSEDVSGSQQGASELSAPGVLEGTESMDDLGDGSLKGAMDMEGASAGSPDFERVPEIPVNDFDEDEDEDDDDNDRVCDMDVGSERTDDLQRPRHDNDVDDEEEEEEEEDEDVDMASEGVTESGLESYGNADEDDFAEDERLDNLNRVAQPPPPAPPLLPSAPAAQWDQPNPFIDAWAESLQPQQVPEHVSQAAGAAAAASPLADPFQVDSETPTQAPAQAWLGLGSAPFFIDNQEAPHRSSVEDEPINLEAQLMLDQSSPLLMQTMAPVPFSAPGMSLSSTLSSETSTPDELCDYNRDEKLKSRNAQAPMLSPQPDLGTHMYRGEEEEDEAEDEAETLPADEVLGGPATAPTSNPSSSSVTEDEASDTEGEAQLDDSLESPALSHMTFDSQPLAQRGLSTVEEGEEAETEEGSARGDTTPASATSLASYGFDTMTTASNSNAQSTGESCIKSPGIFSLEELPEEAKEPGLIPQPLTQACLAEQQYIECHQLEAGSTEFVRENASGLDEALDVLSTPCTLQKPEENPDDIQPAYYSAICEKTENSFAGFTALPHRREHAAYPRTYCDIVKPLCAAVTSPKLTCADLPPRSLGQHALSPQLRRLEQHQRHLLEMQQRREQQNRPLEEAEQERKRREEEEQRRKKEEAEEEIKRNKEQERKKREEAEEEMKLKKNEERKTREQAEMTKKEEELKQRRDLELQLQEQQQELKQRQQIMQWQQELQQSNTGQTVLLSPSSGLCTIYEALENSDEEEAEDEEMGINKLNPSKEKEPKKDMSNLKIVSDFERVMSDKEKHQDSLPSTNNHPEPPETPSPPSQDNDSSSPCPPESPERPPPLDLDWGKKVDIVQQLINQTLLLNGDGCMSLLRMPGCAGGTLSPLESSLWPTLLPPLTPPSATVTSVSSFSPEATGSSPQGEWTVVELETHH
ncbi:platelet binding protein GspB [Hippoglossus stenolepis]|uniref:platelet binding protein GspB n=1 Tax=Hippoglossus stenolepis TaxID=195615 RepID=UPI001FAE8DCF|nr:platelet binding protein GspB [Hippoglossus stenolepis]